MVTIMNERITLKNPLQNRARSQGLVQINKDIAKSKSKRVRANQDIASKHAVPKQELRMEWPSLWPNVRQPELLTAENLNREDLLNARLSTSKFKREPANNAVDNVRDGSINPGVPNPLMKPSVYPYESSKDWMIFLYF